jgi:hypothetical protein
MTKKIYAITGIVESVGGPVAENLLPQGEQICSVLRKF